MNKRAPTSRIHPSFLDDADLLKDCRVEFGRASGPGGQNRNKVETAATLTHVPTGISATANERRSQMENRREAIFRLRLKLAREHRRLINPREYEPTGLWLKRRQGDKMSVNPEHRDYPALLAEALDVVSARGCDVAGSAGLLGITMSQLARLIRHDKAAFAMVNEGRVSRGLPALK